MRLADDWVTRKISLGRRDVWVAKDPATDQFFFFEEHEWAVLQAAESVAPGATLGRDVAGFYRDAGQIGLLVDDSDVAVNADPIASALNPSHHASTPKWYSNPLAIRWPLMNPADMLDRILRCGDWFERSRLKWSAFAVVMLALIVGLSRLDSLTLEIAAASSRILEAPGGTWVLLMIAIGLVKIVHELAHGLACHAGGGRCRELGLLFLFGVPCLYCDVSDTWLMPLRRQRVFVSAAGMIAEVMIASIALFVWASTYHGLIHDIAAMVVIVASVSTVIVNINPLLRYDGYFILSDFAGVPNLSGEANAAVRQWWTGTRNHEASWGLIAYAFASGLYRIIVITLIAWFVCGALGRWIGIGVAVPAGLWIASRMLRRWFAGGLQNRNESRDLPRRWIAALTMIVTGAILFVPLPQSIRVGGLIRPVGELAVYSPATGRVETRDRSVRILDYSLQLQALAAQGNAQEIETTLRGFEIDRLNDPAVASVLPTWRRRGEIAREQFEAESKRLDQMSIELPSGASWFEPPRSNRSTSFSVGLRSNSSDQPRVGDDAPLDAFNANAVIEKQTMLGRIGQSRHRVVSAYVPGYEMDLIRIGQIAVIGAPDRPAGTIVGRVTGTASDPIDELPLEIVASGWVRRGRVSGEQNVPESVHYEVTIGLPDDVDLPARHVPSVRIRTQWESIWTRVHRLIRSTLSW